MATMRELLAAKRAKEAAKGRPEQPGRAVPKLSSAPTPEEQAILDQHKAKSAGTVQPRNLGERVADVPFVFPSDSDSPEAALWKKALLMPSTKLGIVLEPNNGDRAWLAVQSEEQAELILIHPLPLLNRVAEGAPY